MPGATIVCCYLKGVDNKADIFIKCIPGKRKDVNEH